MTLTGAGRHETAESGPDRRFELALEEFVAAIRDGRESSPDGEDGLRALRALEAGFGRAPAVIGCGGTIPFVGPFSEAMGGIPQLLLGLEDPPCNAHGENESLDVDDFRKAAKASAHLLAELAGPGG